MMGFEEEPYSMTQATKDDVGDKSGMIAICEEGAASDLFNSNIQRDTRWTESPNRWASRWDNYLKMTGEEIHCFFSTGSLSSTP